MKTNLHTYYITCMFVPIAHYIPTNNAGKQVLVTCCASMTQLNPSLFEFFCSWGLEEHAASLIVATDATTVEDLMILDEAMVQQVIADVDLRCVSARKFEAAVAILNCFYVCNQL